MQLNIAHWDSLNMEKKSGFIGHFILPRSLTSLKTTWATRMSHGEATELFTSLA